MSKADTEGRCPSVSAACQEGSAYEIFRSNTGLQ